MLKVLADVAPAPSVGEIVVGAAGLAVGLAVAAWAGAFRGRSIAGRSRMEPTASTLPLWISIFAAITMQLMVAGFVGAAMLGPRAPQASAEMMTPHQLIVLSLTASAASLITLVTLYFFHQPRWRLTTSPLKSIRPAIVGSVAVIPMVIGFTILTGLIWYLLKLPAEKEHALLTALNDSHASLDRWMVILSAVIIAPLNEELLFRGHLQSAIRQLTRRPWLSVFIAGVFFAAAHQSLWMSIPLFVLAVGLGYVYERTGSLIATMFIHGAFNAIMIGVDLMVHKS